MALAATKDRPLTADQMANVQKAALAACDALDGVKDGLIDDPRKCHFDPSALLCQGAAPAGSPCLTQLQIDAFKKIYAGPKDAVTGMQIYPGYEPGTEGEPGAWIPWIVPGMGIPTSIQAMFGNSMYAQAVHENPQWDWKNADLHRELQLADEKTGAILNAYNPDFRTFRAHGGKLIQYHGWGDAAIAPLDSIDFYEKAEGFFRDYPDPRSTRATDVHAFYRLFMVPGMGHCAGGPGPTSFGNDDSRIPADAEHDVLKALDRWVTTGAAPDQLIGTGKVAGTALTRPLCAYPNIAKYQGTGDTNAAESFACVPNGKE
jgi:feruloyl esterase